jgi:beta-lactam-binding protein with PASTA domain
MTLIPPNPDAAQPRIIRLGAASLASDATDDALLPLVSLQLGTAPTPTTFAPIPTWNEWAKWLTLFVVAGLGAHVVRRHGAGAVARIAALLVIASAGITLAITKDGLVSDWVGDRPLITDPRADVLGSADVVALWAKVDGSELALRIDVALALESPAGNAPPSISGLSDQTITLPTNALWLAPTVSDDGLPAGSTLSYAWSIVSGSQPVFFGTDTNTPPSVLTEDRFTQAQLSNRKDTAAFFDLATPGVYVLRFNVSDGSLSTHRDFTVTVRPAASQPLAIGPIPDQTVRVGDTLNFVLSASDPNLPSTLSYALVSAPSGAVLAPTDSKHFAFTPTVGQVGTHIVRVRASASSGKTTEASFNVIVQANNRPPRFTSASTADARVQVGAPFARTLEAVDPDAGDSLVYALVSGPAGLTVSGAGALTWTPAAFQLAENPVKVQVADSAGNKDVRLFALRVDNNVPPSATNDHYEVRTGETLTVNATRGVLTNDVDADGSTLTATKLSDPVRGSLIAFASDGSFTYQAPALATPSRLQVRKRWAPRYVFGTAGADTDYGGLLIGDIDRDGIADIIRSDQAGYTAFDGATGTVKWTQAVQCQDYALRAPGSGVLVDIDDDGELEYVGAQYGDPCSEVGRREVGTRLFALQARTGTLKWAGPRLEPLMADHQDAPSVAGDVRAAYQTSLTAARISEGEKPKLIFATSVGARAGPYTRMDGTLTEAGCRAYSGRAEDDGIGCRVTYIVDSETGVIENQLISPHASAVLSTFHARPYDIDRRSTEPPVVIDLDGDGVAEIIARGDVWKRNAATWSLWWKSDWSPETTAVADLDGDGTLEVIMVYPWKLGSSGEVVLGAPFGIQIFSTDGQLKRRIPLPGSTRLTTLTVADVDGDSVPEMLLAREGQLDAIRSDGRTLWTFRFLGMDGLFDGQPIVPPLTAPPPTGVGRDARNVVDPIDRSRNTVPSVYDLNGDGIKEVIVSTSVGTYFLNGRTGQPQAVYGLSGGDNNGTNFGFEQAAVIDVDGDGQAEVVTTTACPYSLLAAEREQFCDTFVTVLENANPAQSWLPAPRQWGQMSFADGQISDNSRLSVVPTRTSAYRTPLQRGTIADERASDKSQFTYAASDGTFTSNTATVSIDLLPLNRPPKITSSLSVTGTNFQPFEYRPAAIDPDAGDLLTYSVVVPPSCTGLTVEPVTGRVSCTLNNGGVPLDRMTIRVTDSQGAFDEQTVLISMLGPNATVPSVVGQTRAAAELTLTRTRFVPGSITEIHDAAAAGTTISQAPNAGVSTPTGSAVDLIVSKGPRPVLVPNLVGSSEPLARSRLTGLGFGVAVTRMYSSTIPTGVVTTQSVAAGTQTIPANIELGVSAGNGLALALSAYAITANSTLTVQPIAFGLNGESQTPPALTYRIEPRFSRHAGALPTLSGTTISASTETLGAFTVIATDSIGGRTASADFTVFAPTPTGKSSNGQKLSALLSTLYAMDALAPTLSSALASNNEALMRSTLAQFVQTWRTLDLKAVRRVTPIVPTVGFVPTEEDVLAIDPTLQPTADDLLMQQTLRASIEDLQTVTAALRAPGTPVATLSAGLDTFYERIRLLEAITMSEFGAVINAPEIITLTTRTIPDFYEALTNELAVPAGLLPRDEIGASAFVGDSAKSTLSELTTGLAVQFAVDKVVETLAAPYRNAKKYASDLLAQGAWAAAVMGARGWALSVANGEEITGIATGASQSFHIFDAPGSFIEIPTSVPHRSLVNITIIGPDVATNAAEVITDWRNKIQSGWSFARDALTNPDRFRNIDEIEDLRERVSMGLTQLGTLQSDFKNIANSAQQSASTVEFGCIFVTGRRCTQLVFDDGITPVYTYKPPGTLALGFTGLPLPMLMLIEDKRTGRAFFGTPVFFPSKK